MLKLRNLISEVKPPKDGLDKKIIAFVENTSWFSFDNDDDDQLSFATRDHGSVHDETPGAADFKEANKLAKAIKSKFPKVTRVSIDEADEWVMVRVDVPKELMTKKLPQKQYGWKRSLYKNKEAGGRNYSAGISLTTDIGQLRDWVYKYGGGGDVWQKVAPKIAKLKIGQEIPIKNPLAGKKVSGADTYLFITREHDV